MPGWQKVGGGAAWSTRATRSQSVRDYMQAHDGARPKAELRKAGEKIEIRSGARVIRARGFGVSFRRGIGRHLKNFALLFGRAGQIGLRNRNRRLRHAEHDFDKGVNRMVEDIANGKARSAGDIAAHLKALHEPAQRLVKYGRASTQHLEERFESNLRESLQALEEADPKRAAEVRQVLQEATPGLRQGLDAMRSPTSRDQQRVLQNLEQLGLAAGPEPARFATGLLQALHRTAVFGSDEAVSNAFGNSMLTYQAFGGDAEKARSFGGDVVALQAFRGDAEAYEKFGGCAALRESFGHDLESLAGQDGGARLKDWVDTTYGEGAGEAFFRDHRALGNGIGSADELSALGKNLQNELEPYRDKSYTPADVTVDKLVSGGNQELRSDFDAHAVSELNAENLRWLRDLHEARSIEVEGHEDQARAAIGKLAGSISSNGDVNVGSHDRKTLIKTLYKQARKPYDRQAATLEEGLGFLQDMKADQLRNVVERGFAEAKSSMASNVGDSILRFKDKINETVENRKRASAYKQLINDRHGDVAGSSVADDLFVAVRDRAGDQVDRNQRLTPDDLPKLDDEIWRMQRRLTPHNVRAKLAQQSSQLPQTIHEQWREGLESGGNLTPTADTDGVISPQDAGIRTYLDRRVVEASASEEAPTVSGQFLRDVDRVDVDVAHGDHDLRLDQQNGAAALHELADGDDEVSLNLSKFVQQGLFNGMHGALGGKVTTSDGQPVIPLIEGGRSSVGDGKAVQLRIAKQDDNYVLDYRWTPRLQGFSRGAAPTPANPDKSGVVATTRLTISADDLRSGNLSNYQLSDINYHMHAELDPVALTG